MRHIGLTLGCTSSSLALPFLVHEILSQSKYVSGHKWLHPAQARISKYKGDQRLSRCDAHNLNRLFSQIELDQVQQISIHQPLPKAKVYQSRVST